MTSDSSPPPFGFTWEKFKSDFCESTKGNFNTFEFVPTISAPRLRDAYDAWIYDLKHDKDNFKDRQSKPDHIKCSGYLMHWIGRMRPITEVSDNFLKYATEAEKHALKITVIQDESCLKNYNEPTPIEDDEIPEEVQQDFLREKGVSLKHFKEHRGRLSGYANEYAAYDFCYRLARDYEVLKLQEQCVTGDTPEIPYPTPYYIHDFCNILKYKNISPQAIAFIFRTSLHNWKVL